MNNSTEFTAQLKQALSFVAGFAKRAATVVAILSIALVTLGPSTGLVAADEVSLPDRQDTIIFIRHALAPGTGDPAEFDVDVCSTQRNLSQQGRLQAEDIGVKLRNLGFNELPIYTSQWCRCRETAELTVSYTHLTLPTTPYV